MYKKFYNLRINDKILSKVYFENCKNYIKYTVEK